MQEKLTTRNETDTINFAQNIAQEAFPNMVICLEGDLGSGKTVFAKGFAHALGIPENITSPTFNIIKEYESGELPLYHMDVYRLNGDASSLGLDEYFNKGGVTIVEWADLISEHLPEKRLDIKIRIINENTRILTCIPRGEEYERICESVL